jgi:outer membrane protein assembly factor BamA
MKQIANFAIVSNLLLTALPAFGETRTEEYNRQRQEHDKELTPEKTTRLESLLRRIKDEKLLERANYGYNGVGLKVGGLVTGGGFAIGPQYLRDDLRDGAVAVRGSAQISFRNYRKADAQLVLPKLLGGKAFFDLRTTYRNFPSLSYYGPGPDSHKVRTDYRLEDTSVDAAFGVSPVRHLTLGAAGGGLAVNIGPGTDSRFVSSDAVFTPVQSPGIDRQTNFFRYGVFGQFDWRDDPFGPRNGGNYVLQYTRFEDRDLHRHDFNLIDVDLQQYVGFFNKSRVIALRAHTRLTDTREGQVVPFYLQPMVGGPDDLRGFRPFRFSGNNSLVLNGEYRWAIFSGCDGALFVDGGKVFSRRGQLNFRDLEGSAGFGLRFNARNRTFIRVDVGFSHEGFQVWFKFSEAFNRRPLGTAESETVF